MSFTAFRPSGATTLVAASSSTASTPAQVSTGSQQGMHIVNGSTTLPVYVTAGSSSVQAACPTTAVPANGLCIPAGQYVNLATAPQGWLSAATSGGSASVFATPGFGGS